MDNDTLVEAFKFLNCAQLAKSRLVSKRFSNIIQTHRHSLQLLYVDYINMKCYDRATTSVRIFDQTLSPEEYNEWVIGNGYSKQVPLECQAAEMESTQNSGKFYGFGAHAIYSDPIRRPWDITSVLYARGQLNHENWPLFQHFIGLITDPGIYIRSLELTPQNDVLNLLARAMNPYHNRLQGNVLVLNLEDNVQKLMSWIKEHVLCKELRIYNHSLDSARYDEELLEFFMTAAQSISEINVRYYDLSKVVFDLVKKFMEIKDRDEYNVVQSIGSNAADKTAMEEFKREYAEFSAKEENDNRIATHTFEFVNNDVGKKLKLIITNRSNREPCLSLKFDNL
ncbi:hypothetical protein Ddc_16512 [Ditylenchus destructor]|nr:hypothetical protein Ddc_16512 [Ditylenchus destructor]